MNRFLLGLFLVSAGGLFAWSGCAAQDDLLSPFRSSEDATASEADGGAGGGAMITVDCSEAADAHREAGSCDAGDQESPCQTCVQQTCCELQQQCYATSPETPCGFGSTLLSGQVVPGGEIGCMMACFDERLSRGELEGAATDVEACARLCGASECGTRPAAQSTQALAACILGTEPHPNGANCRAECGF